MKIFEKCSKVSTREKPVIESGLFPYFIARGSIQNGSKVRMDGADKLMLASNDYLGLASDTRVIESSAKFLKAYGTSCSGSRFVSGSLDIHKTLENQLAAFMKKEDCIVFMTGYMTNIGAISSLINSDLNLIVDKKIHASLLDGICLGRGMFGKGVKMHRYKHDDMNDLEKKLQALPYHSEKLLISEGVFSIEGTIANLPEMIRQKQKYNCPLYIDDAHGIGVFGKSGGGILDLFNAHEDVDLIVGTFSKAFGATGGFIAGNKQIIHHIRYSRPFIFSSCLTPANVGAILKSLEIIKTEPELRQKLTNNTNLFREELLNMGLSFNHHSSSPIISINTGTEKETFALWKKIYDNGVYLNPFVSPVTPKNKCVLKLCITAKLTHLEIEFALEVLNKATRPVSLVHALV